MSDGAMQIARHSLECIDDLCQLYAALHEHHAAVAPTLGGMPSRSTAESWVRRRASYVTWLSKPGAFVLIATRSANQVGYALVSLGEAFQSWSSAERVGDVHDLVVAPDERGRGVGTALMNAVEDELASSGVERIRLNVMLPNAEALRFYGRRGMEPISQVLLARIDRPSRGERGR